MSAKAKISGSVVAGFPSPAEQYLEPPLDLNEFLIKRPAATYFVRVEGDSMIGAGIHDGDLLVVDRSLRPASGDVIIASVDGDFTVKTLRLGREGTGNREQGTGNGEQGTGNKKERKEKMKTTISDYRDLKVWQKSMSLCEEVYALIKMFPAEERYALCDQLRRAVVSIPSNIAEGNGRDSRTEYARFLAIARGSVFEVQTQLELAERFGYIKVPSSTQESLVEISKILYTLIRKLRTT